MRKHDAGSPRFRNMRRIAARRKPAGAGDLHRGREATQALSRKIETTSSSPFLAGDAQKTKPRSAMQADQGYAGRRGDGGWGGTRPAQDQREAVRLGSGIGQSFLVLIPCGRRARVCGRAFRLLPASFRVAGPASRTCENTNDSQDPRVLGGRAQMSLTPGSSRGVPALARRWVCGRFARLEPPPACESEDTL